MDNLRNVHNHSKERDRNSVVLRLPLFDVAMAHKEILLTSDSERRQTPCVGQELWGPVSWRILRPVTETSRRSKNSPGFVCNRAMDLRGLRGPS